MKAKLLIIDDNVSFLHSMEFLLSGEYEVFLASDGRKALRIAEEKEIDVALVDVRMPGMSGVETLRRLKFLSPKTEVIVITAHGKGEVVGKVLSEGAFGFLEKGFSFQELKDQLKEALKGRRMKERVLRELKRYLLERSKGIDEEVIKVISSALNLDPSITAYLSPVEGYVASMIEVLNLSEREEISLRTAAVLHDIGMLTVGESILKKPEPLEKGEWEAIKRHPIAGAELLRRIGDETAAEIVLCHHERIDGSGYPRGLKGREIPFLSQIVAVADLFDAMTSDRPYRKALSKEEAVNKLMEMSKGSKLDPEAVKLFCSSLSRTG